MPRTHLLALTLAAACWLAGGPGGITLRAWAACRHHHEVGGEAAQGHHMQSVPPGTPCFCDQMAGGTDWLLTVEVVPPQALGVELPCPESVAHIPPPPSLFSGFIPAPPTPPPIART